GLEAQRAPGALALDREDDLLEAADLARRELQVLDLPALVLGVAPVDPVQVGGEQRRFVAADAGADLDDHLPPQVRRLGDQRGLDLAVDRSLFALERLQVLARERSEIRITT